MTPWHTVDLTDFDLAPAVRGAGALTRKAVDVAKDATYITVGFGLLVFQRAQVQRREFEKSLRT